MFKRDYSKRTSTGQYAFKIFFVHVINIIVLYVIGMLYNAIESIEGVSISDSSLFVFETVVLLAIYVIFIYTDSWHIGAHDMNMVLYKRLEYNRFKPLIAGVLSQLPGLLLAAAILIPAWSDSARRFARFFYIDLIYPIMQIDTGGSAGVWIYFLAACIAPVIAVSAYHLGYREIRILDKLMFKKPAKPDDKKTER